MPAPLVIDPQTIENLRKLNPGDNDEFLREIIAIYLEDTPRRLVELEQGLRTADRPTFTRAAHSIKGSSANVGAMAVRAVAESLERRSANEDLAGLTGLITELKAEFERARLEFARLLQRD
ncbi:MAG TPA: Hpt domain-containing protein [Opitutus sp.]|nr:Hpt domain-containing protein [Opitutus sp.]